VNGGTGERYRDRLLTGGQVVEPEIPSDLPPVPTAGRYTNRAPVAAEAGRDRVITGADRGRPMADLSAALPDGGCGVQEGELLASDRDSGAS
jgi:hypothetical protein